MASRPTCCLVPGMTKSRSSTFSMASTRWRTDSGSVPMPGKRRLSSFRSANSVSGVGPLFQVGQRVTGKAVPGEALDTPRDERPAHRRGDRNEQLVLVDQRRRLAEQGIALAEDRSLARGVHQLVGIAV